VCFVVVAFKGTYVFTPGSTVLQGPGGPHSESQWAVLPFKFGTARDGQPLEKRASMVYRRGHSTPVVLTTLESDECVECQLGEAVG
jgi:hypothetical protein